MNRKAIVRVIFAFLLNSRIFLAQFGGGSLFDADVPSPKKAAAAEPTKEKKHKEKKKADTGKLFGLFDDDEGGDDPFGSSGGGGGGSGGGLFADSPNTTQKKEPPKAASSAPPTAAHTATAAGGGGGLLAKAAATKPPAGGGLFDDEEEVRAVWLHTSPLLHKPRPRVHIAAPHSKQSGHKQTDHCTLLLHNPPSQIPGPLRRSVAGSSRSEACETRRKIDQWAI